MARAIVFATLGLAMACADGGPKSPIAPYALQTVGASPLPFTMYEEQGYKLEVTAGTLELAEPDKFSMATTVIETVDGNKSTYTDSEGGTWTLGENGSVTIDLTGGEKLTAVWDKTRLTVTREGVAFAYEMSGR